MTEFGNPYYLGGVSFKHNVAQFSPSGGRFVIVVKKGNIAKNTNDYSILSFRSEEALRSPSPQVVASFSSTSERPGIQDLTWVDDETIAFLGEGPGELQQLYTVDCETKQVLRLTNHATNVVSYAIAKNKERIFFTAQAPKEKLFGDMAAREGFTVSNEMLADLILGESRKPYPSDTSRRTQGSDKCKGRLAGWASQCAPSQNRSIPLMLPVLPFLL